MNLSRNPDGTGRSWLWLGWLLLALLTAVVLATRTLTPIDETRYVAAAWEMWQRSDFLVPFKNGEPYSHKPPFFFWVFHAGWAVFGVNDWWPRLVVPLFSAASLALAFGLARRLWPQRPGIPGTAVLVLATTLWWMLFSTTTMFDVLLAFWVLVGMTGTWIAAEGRRRGFALLGLAIGMGVLTKGPVILLHLLPAAVLAPWWHPGLRWGRWAGGLALAVLLGAAIALAWAVPAGYSGGEAYRKAIFWGQTANRMVDSFAHRRPFWWYLPMLPLLLFPWFVWPGLWQALARLGRGGLDAGARFCLAWMLPVFVAFCFVSGKQLHYLIPLFPAFALLVTRALDGQAPPRWSGLPVLLAALPGLALVAVAAGLAHVRQDELAALPWMWPAAGVVVVALLAAAALWRGRAPVPVLGLLSAASLMLVLTAVKPSIEPLYDIRPMAQAIHGLQQKGITVANLQGYHAQYQFAGRLQAPLVVLDQDTPQQIDWLRTHPQAYAVVYFSDARALDDLKALHRQRYRGGAIALMQAPDVVPLLGPDGAAAHPLLK